MKAMMLTGIREMEMREVPTHRFSFEDTKAAFDLVAGYKDGVMKAMVDFE